MIAEDYDGTKPRLDGVRADIKSIASSFAGARFSVIAFDNSPFTPLPFTSDASALFTTVDILYPIDTFNSTGSNITSSLQDAEAAARRVLDSHPDRKVVLFYLGDGEQTSDQDISIPSSLSELLSGGAVLGYGTEAGGRMQEVWLHSTANDIRYIQDRSSQWPWPDALSKIDEDNLRAIAESLEIPYFHRTEPNSTKEITDQVEQSARRFSGSGTQASTDIYWILCLILIALLFWELNGVVVRLSSSKRSRS
jgi:Ca-activated chloride channel family protein